MPVNVNVTDKQAIYVDNHRITDRGTKWGMHNSIDEFKCATKADVAQECINRGHAAHVRRIDENGYGKDRK